MEKIDIAAIGNSEEVFLFNAVGISTFVVKEANEADKKIFELSQAECKIVYLFEELS